MNSCLITREDPKLVELSRLRGVCRIDLVYSACGWLLSLKLYHESGDRISCAFNHDFNARITQVANKPDKFVRGCDSVDEGSEPHPLDDALDEKSSPRYASHPVHSGAAQVAN